MNKTAKVILDIAAGLLFVLLLGYSFLGGQLHEIFGVLFAAVVIAHNIINRAWYASLKKGNYSKKRKIAVVINLALILDTAALVLTGVINSRYLFRTGLHIAPAVQLHAILASVDFALIIAHILVHGINFSKKGAGKRFAFGTALALIAAVLLHTWMLPYVKRHFNTVNIDREEVIAGRQVDADGRKIVIVYFTRTGNSNFEADVDAVSGASLLLNEEEELMGNCEVLALMAEDAVAGDLVPIRVEAKYPSSYQDTVSAASDELHADELPALVELPESLDEYDTVVLIYPLWWYTIPKPVEAFLRNYDFSGKTVLPVVTHGGSGAGDSIRDIKAVCNGTVIEDPLIIYCGDIPYCRDSVGAWLEEIFSG